MMALELRPHYGTCEARVILRERKNRAKILFIIFVDRIFTTLFERLFTKLLDVIGASPATSCLCRGCNAD
jgi:hypothetical protein